jgi:hypothetical protein
MLCTCCYGGVVPRLRWEAGYRTCLPCGEKAARIELRRKASMCQPINKSTPIYIHDPRLLTQLNPKRTT